VLRSLVLIAALCLPLAAATDAQPAPDGIPNFHAVTGNLYRSGQPKPEGFRSLVRQYGIRTVISLRSVASDDSLLKGSGAKIRLRRFRLHAGSIGHERETIVAALRAIRAGIAEGPTLVHCEYGSDRTGLIVALYRIVYQNWTKDAALREMRDKAYGFHTVWGNIPRFIEELDVDRFRARLESSDR
jgi:protein tyrosine/serine phosphatase